MRQDVMGREVCEGDPIAYALQYGNSPSLATYKVVSVSEQGVRAIKLSERGRKPYGDTGRVVTLSMVDTRGVVL